MEIEPGGRCSHSCKPSEVAAAAASSSNKISQPIPIQENDAEESSSISDFMRFKNGGGTAKRGSGELQTAVVSYRKKFPWLLLQPFLQVDLVSTVHIAGKEYFDILQKALQENDCVLYEMVASRKSLENRRNSPATRRLKASHSKGFNILGFIQRQMARILALDFQLDCLITSLTTGYMQTSILKPLRCCRFTQMTASVEEKSVIIGERNRVATEALQRAIESGNKRIAVLYGGGHMPDFGRRLREEFDLVPYQVQWITAWSIRKQELDNQSLPFLRTLAKVSGWPLNRYQTLALFIFSSVLALDLWFWELFFGSVVNWASWAASEVNMFIDNVRFMYI